MEGGTAPEQQVGSQDRPRWPHDNISEALRVKVTSPREFVGKATEIAHRKTDVYVELARSSGDIPVLVTEGQEVKGQLIGFLDVLKSIGGGDVKLSDAQKIGFYELMRTIEATNMVDPEDIFNILKEAGVDTKEVYELSRKAQKPKIWPFGGKGK